MKVETTRFGQIDVPDEDIIKFPEGILGFNGNHEYVILNDPSTEPLRWLQSLENPDLAFVIIDPLKFRDEYSIDLSDEEVEALELQGPEEAIIYAIVVIPKEQPEKMTANLQGPIVINASKMIAKQVISTNSKHKLKHYVLDEMKAMLASTQKKFGKVTLNLNRKEKGPKKVNDGEVG